jgi:L-aminopeptidase/D-esterase-like protein
MQYLEERSIGYQTSAGRVPIVPTAIIYDLGLGDGKIRPDKQMGYQACENAQSGPVAVGSVGAGTGASVGKLYSIRFATKGGVGTASVVSASGLIVGALVVVNAFGDVVDPRDQRILAGARDPRNPDRFANSAARIKAGAGMPGWNRGIQNTTLGVVATNAKLSKRQTIKVSQMAQSGLVRTISPVHSTVDGDLVFALSAGEKTEDVNTVGMMAEEALAAAVLQAVQTVDGMGLLPADRDLHP